MLGNLPPQQRSITRGIQLLTLAKCLTIEKYGIDRILKPLIKDLLKLIIQFLTMPCVTISRKMVMILLLVENPSGIKELLQLCQLIIQQVQV